MLCLADSDMIAWDSRTKRYFPQHQKRKFKGRPKSQWGAHDANIMGPNLMGAPKFYDTGNEVMFYRKERCNRKRNCYIPRISPPLRFVLRLRLQKWGHMWDTNILVVNITIMYFKCIVTVMLYIRDKYIQF